MSLWKNTDGPKDAPVWYARHCIFNGKNVADNKIDLSKANTSFKTGDCVIYLSNTPIIGLSNEGVYYVRAEGGFRFSLYNSRANAKSGTGAIALTATTADSNQLFVEYDRKSTTNEGKERPALIAVDKETAKLRVNGLVSPGWYRYFTYKNSANQDRFHLELLAGVKTMAVTPVESYSVTCKFFSETVGENKFDKSTSAPAARVNKLVFEITTAGPVHKDINLIFDAYNVKPNGNPYRHFWGDQKGSQMNFQWEYNGESPTSLPGEQAGAHPTHAYITVPVDVDEAQTVTAEIVMKSGNYTLMSVDSNPNLKCFYGNPEDINNIKDSEFTQLSCTGEFGTPKYTVTIQGMHGDDPSVPERFIDGWKNYADPAHNLLVMTLTANEDIVGQSVDFVVLARDAYGMNLITGCDPKFTFSDVSTGESGAIAMEDGRYKKTYTITANAGETVTKVWNQETGEPVVLENPIKVTLNTVSATIGNSKAEQSFTRRN